MRSNQNIMHFLKKSECHLLMHVHGAHHTPKLFGNVVNIHMLGDRIKRALF